jgi:hypothetical protein
MRAVAVAVILGAAAAMSLATASSAYADGPTVTPVSRIVTTPIPFGASCGDFQILFTVDAEGTNIDFYNGQNQLSREIRHVAFTGELYNSDDLSTAVPYDGAFTRVFDATTNTYTLTGQRFQVRLPGQGTVAIDAGREVVDAVTGTATSESGRGLDEFVQEVCAALS